MDSFYRSPMLQAINDIFSDKYSAQKIAFTEPDNEVSAPKELPAPVQLVGSNIIGNPEEQPKLSKEPVIPGMGYNQQHFKAKNRIEPGMGYGQPVFNKSRRIEPGMGFDQSAFSGSNKRRIEPGQGFSQPVFKKRK